MAVQFEIFGFGFEMQDSFNSKILILIAVVRLDRRVRRVRLVLEAADPGGRTAARSRGCFRRRIP